MKNGKPSPDTGKVLTLALWYLRANPELQVVIEGHGDRKRKAATSMKMGTDRALAIKRYLVDAGINENRVTNPVSRGNEQLICAKPKKECDQLTRRVVLKLIGGAKREINKDNDVQMTR